MAEARAAHVAGKRGKSAATSGLCGEKGESDADAVNSSAAAGAEHGPGTLAGTGGGIPRGAVEGQVYGCAGPAAGLGRGRRRANWAAGGAAPVPWELLLACCGAGVPAAAVRVPM